MPDGKKFNNSVRLCTQTLNQHLAQKIADVVMRRPRGLAPELVARRPGVSPPPPAKLPSKRWRDLILRVWNVDPLRCPVCQNPMRVIPVY
jgi:hypothetical protein